jgi:hypothetical protein
VNTFSGLKVLKTCVYCGLTLPKSTGVCVGLTLFALTANLLPAPLENTAPRGTAVLNRSRGMRLGAASASGTASQLISRRPIPCDPGVEPLFGSPTSARKASTVPCRPAALPAAPWIFVKDSGAAFAGELGASTIAAGTRSRRR